MPLCFPQAAPVRHGRCRSILFQPRRAMALAARLAAAAVLMVIVSTGPVGAAEEAAPAPRLVTPAEATTGALMFESAVPGRYVEAPLIAADVKIEITGPLARTRLTQRFQNISDQWLEGVYVFPLPDEAAVDTLKMQIGDRFIEGRIEEKKKAKALYDKAKAAGKKASLLTQERANIFTNAVANIGPGETVIVQIEYQENVRLDANVFSLRFPMVVAPRFNPPALIEQVSFDGGAGWGTRNAVPDRSRITPPVMRPEAARQNRVSLSVDLNAGFALGDVTSAYHEVVAAPDGDRRVRLTLAEGATPANKDFELRWSPKAGAAPSAALFKEEIAGEPYFLLMLTPPSGIAAAPRAARSVTFVIDTSGSMGGASIRQAKASLALAIERLSAEDVFNVIEFNSVHRALFEAPRPASRNNRAAALSFVRSLTARGGTMMAPALSRALGERAEDKTRLRQIIFLTDGAIGNEQQLFELIAARRGGARIFTVGIGSAPNSYFMARAAEIGRGAFTHIGSVDEVGARMGALFQKLETPAVTDLALQWPDGVAAEVWPSPLPDLYAGETLVVAAKVLGDKVSGDDVLRDNVSGERGPLTVSGSAAGQPWRTILPLEAAARRKGVSKLWARKKIASLELARSNGQADRDALDGAVLKVALTHQLVSRLTSLVALDATPSRPVGQALTATAIPLQLPEGWDFDAVFGPGEREALREARMRTPDAVSAGLNAPDGAAQSSAQQASAPFIDLPQGAALSDVKLIVGLVMMAAALIILLLFRRLTPPGAVMARVNGGGLRNPAR